MEYRKTHLINEHGDRKVVETRNADKELQQLNESTNSQRIITETINNYLKRNLLLVS
jgi:hypothetical protein